MTQLELANYILKKLKEENVLMNSGNCGMFAYALNQAMVEYNPDYESLFIYFHESKDIDETRELADREIMIYHIALIFDGLKNDGDKREMEVFDADGVVPLKFIYNWIKEEYGEGEDYVSLHMGDDDNNINMFVIRNETAYKNDVSFFYEKIKKIIDNIPSHNMKI